MTGVDRDFLGVGAVVSVLDLVIEGGGLRFFCLGEGHYRRLGIVAVGPVFD